MSNELQETRNRVPTKSQKILRAEVTLSEVGEEWKVRLVRERMGKHRSVFGGYFFDTGLGVGNYIEEYMTENYFGTETEAMKFIKDVIAELKTKNYEVTAKQVKTVVKDLLEPHTE